MITRRENLLRAYRHEMPEWIPVIGMVDNYQIPVGLENRLGSDLNIVTFSRFFGLDIVERYEEARYEKMGEFRRYATPIVKEIHHNVDVSNRREGVRLFRTWKTPYGEIRTTFETVNYPSFDSQATGTEFPTEYPVKSHEDLRAFASIFEDLEYEVDPAGVQGLRQRVAEIGDDGITLVWCPSTPLGMCVRYYMGVETLAYCYHDCRNELEELLEIIGESFLKKQRLLAAQAADGTISGDDTTTRAISPAMFRDLEVPYINRAAAINHGQDKLYVHHSCGHIRGFLDDYARTDMDAVDLLTVNPLGDCTIEDAKRRLGKRIAMMPGFETLTIDQGSYEEIRSMVGKFFEDAAPGDNFIPVLYPQPNTSTVERLQVVVDEARKWQRRVG